MPKFRVSVPHDHPRDQVVNRLQDFSQSIRRESPVELTEIVERWDDQGNLEFSFKAMNLSVSGNLMVEIDQIVVHGKLPLAAVMFRGMIENQIEEKIRQALSTA